MRYLRDNWLPLLVIVAGFGITLTLALAPLSFMLSNMLVDDAFYYFQIARNIVHGLGSTFDGVNPTNGYHPLWLLLLLPIYALLSKPIVLDLAPIHAALALEALFNLGLGLVLLRIISRYTKHMWIAAIALAVWFFNPFNIYEMENGLETALSLFFIGAFMLCAIRVRERMTTPRLIIAGVVGGLMMLSRLDNVFYFVMFLGWLLYEQGWHRGFRSSLRVGIPATIVVSPWLIWNYITFGMLLTSSSAATTIVNHQTIVQDHGPSIAQKVKAVIYFTDYWLRLTAVQTGAPSVFFVLFGITCAWAMYTYKSVRRLLERRISLELFLFGGFVLNFIANASIRWSPREWYFIPLDLFMVLWIAWLLERLREGGMLRKEIVIAGVVLTLSLFYITWSKDLRGTYNTGTAILASTMWMNDNLPQGTVIGAFNAGIQGYFSTHQLINLDGLVNNNAYEAIKRRQVWAYVKSEHIQYVSDFGNLVSYRMKSFLGTPDFYGNVTPIHETDNGPTVYLVK